MANSQSRYGVDEVYDSGNALVDIVLVHGLFGNRNTTWTSPDGVFWPKQLLPKDVPQARVITFGYDADVVATEADQEVAESRIEGHAADICNKLVSIRGQDPDRPVIFIAHSMGGLVCAQAIVMGERSVANNNTSIIYSHTRGIIFLGTPIYGAAIAKWGEMLRKLVGLVSNTNPNYIKDLGNAEKLRDLAVAFSEVLGKRDIEGKRIGTAFLIEMLKTEILRVGKFTIVDQDSAWIPGRGDHAFIHASHKAISKFASREDEGYKMVVDSIKKFLRMPNKKTEGITITAKTIGQSLVGDLHGDMVAGDKFKGDKFKGDKIMGNKKGFRRDDNDDDDDFKF